MQGYQRKRVTPYMHIMVYHVPKMLRVFGNIKQFSGQGKWNIWRLFTIHYFDFIIFFFGLGVEKNNDDSKRHYFSSNKHDAASEIIRCEARLEMLCSGTKGFPSCERQKCPYQKHDSIGMKEGSRKHGGRDSTQKIDYLHVCIQNGFSKSHPYAKDLTLIWAA